MDLTKLPDDLPIPEDDGACNHLTNFIIPQLVFLIKMEIY